MNAKAMDLGFGALAGALALGVYAWTCPPTLISCGDSAELITAAHTLGVAHPPGYPLYTMAGHAASLLAPGKPAHRLSLFTALAGALTVMNICFCLLLLTRRASAALLGALALAFSYHFWLYSLVPEVAALSGFFLSLLLLILLADAELEPGSLPAWLDLRALFAFVFGLGLSHQFSILLCAPAFILFAALACFLCFIAGLAPYLYIPLRARQMPFMNAGTVDSLERFIAHITRKNWGTSLTPQHTQWSAPVILSSLGFYGESLLRSFKAGGLLLAGLGAAQLFRRGRPAFFLWLAGLLMSGPFFFAIARLPPDSVGNRAILERFLIPSFVLFALALGPGIAWLIEELPSLLLKWFEARPGEKALAWALALPAWLLVQNFSALDFRGFDLCETYGRDLLKTFEPNAVVLVNGDNSLFTLYYLQQAEGSRGDLKLINTSVDAPYLERLRRDYPDLLLPQGVIGPDLVRELIRANIKRFPLYEVGIPGNMFAAYGLMGNPYALQPRGLAFRIVPKFDRTADDLPLWKSYGYRRPDSPAATSNYFAQETTHLYGTALYNGALVYSQYGRRDLALAYARQASLIDPFFARLREAALAAPRPKVP